MLKYETPPKKGVISRFSDDALLNGVQHSLEKQLTGSRYVNTNTTMMATNPPGGLNTGTLFTKQTDSSKKDSGQSVSLFNIPSHSNQHSSPYTPAIGGNSNQKTDAKSTKPQNTSTTTPSFSNQGFANQLSFTPRQTP